MSLPSAPPILEQLGRRPFSFFPPILKIEHNEWLFKQAVWSEILVENTRDGMELWIPRRFLGEVSSIDQPVMIVGLTKELEYKAGAVWPHERRVLPMPGLSETIPAAPAPQRTAPPRPHGPAPRTADSTESRIGRLIGGVLVAGIVLCFLVVFFFRSSPPRSRVTFTANDEDFLQLTRLDDYHAVVRKLGPPAEDRWRSESGELQYRRLWYPQRAYSVILMGTDRTAVRYIGAVDKNWHVVHYVELANGGNTGSMLRSLPRF
jgi:hypothetical protein